METLIQENLKIDKTNWKLVKFGDVVKEPKESIKDPVAAGIEHVVGLEHIGTEDIHLRNSASIEEATTFTKAFKKGDVLFGRRRAYLKKVAQAPFDGICSGDITVFRAKADLLPELLPFVVNNDKFFDYAVKHSAGGLSPRVKFKDLEKYEFLLPPIDEQANFAELLWATDEMIETFIRFKLCLEIFSKVKKEELLISGSLEKTGYFQTAPLGELCDVIDPHPSHRAPIAVTDGLPFIGIGDINEKGEIDLSKVRLISEKDVDKQRKTFDFEANDIGFGRVATIGKVVWLKDQEFKYAVSPTMSIIKPKSEDPNYIYEVLNTEYVKRQYEKMITGSTRRSIGIQKLRTILIPKVSREVQKQLVGIILKINSSQNNTIQKLEGSKSLQKNLINQIF